MMGWISNKLFTGVVLSTLLFTLTGGCDTAPAPTPVITDGLPELPQPVVGGEFPRSDPRDPLDVRIALVGEVRGELEPCGCPTLPYGGFARRSALLDELRKDGPLFHLDAGELLLKGFSTDRNKDRVERAQTLMKLSAEVGVDVWVPGPTDMLMLKSLSLPTGPTRISASYTDAQGRLLYEPTKVLERGGARIGIVGLSAPVMDPEMKKVVHTRDPVEAAKDGLGRLKDNLDLIIALGNISDETAQAVAREVPGLAAVLTIRGGAYDTPAPASLPLAKTPPVIEAPDRGRYVQFLQFRVGAPAGTAALVHPEARLWRERTASGDDGPFTELGRGRNLLGVSTIPLGKDLDGSQAPRAGVTQALDRFKSQSLASAAKRATQAPAPSVPKFASSGGCVHCHSSEFARWSLSGHAKAWMALVERQQTQNPECLPCHTTAWGEPSGLGALTDSGIRKFKGVQCEACHGPMGGHPEDPRVRPKPITEETCVGCHDTANSPDFDYAKYLPMASCQGGSPHMGVAP